MENQQKSSAQKLIADAKEKYEKTSGPSYDDVLEAMNKKLQKCSGEGIYEGERFNFLHEKVIKKLRADGFKVEYYPSRIMDLGHYAESDEGGVYVYFPREENNI